MPETVDRLFQLSRLIVFLLIQESPVTEIIGVIKERDALVIKFCEKFDFLLVKEKINELISLRNEENRLLEPYREELLKVKLDIIKLKHAQAYLVNDLT